MSAVEVKAPRTHSVWESADIINDIIVIIVVHLLPLAEGQIQQT